MSEMFMTSSIGDLPVNSEGMRRAIDEIARLQAENGKLKKELLSVDSLKFANLEAHIIGGDDYPGINIDMTLDNGNIVPLVYVEYYTDDNKWHICVYSDESDDEPVCVFPLCYDLKEAVENSNIRITEIEAKLTNTEVSKDEEHELLHEKLWLENFTDNMRNVIKED